MGKKTCEKLTFKRQRFSYPATDVQSFRILCNFLSHYPQRKTYLIIQMLVSPQCLKGNLKLQGSHLKAFCTWSRTELLRHSATSLRYTNKFRFSRIIPVQWRLFKKKKKKKKLWQSTIKIPGQGHSSLIHQPPYLVLNYRLSNSL